MLTPHKIIATIIKGEGYKIDNLVRKFECKLILKVQAQNEKQF